MMTECPVEIEVSVTIRGLPHAAAEAVMERLAGLPFRLATTIHVDEEGLEAKIREAIAKCAAEVAGRIKLPRDLPTGQAEG